MIERPEMSCEMLRRLGRRELTPRETAEILRHVGGCETCASRFAGVEKQLDALQAAIDDDEGPWHPAHAAIAALVDGTAGPAEREIVASHLEDCALCREDVADLGKLRPSGSGRNPWPAAMAAAAAIAVLGAIIVQRSQTPAPPPAVATAQLPPAVVAPAPPPPAPQPHYANAEWERLVRTAIETRRLPSARGIEASPDALRGPGGGPAPAMSPSAVVIDEVRPRFSWPARAGATYVVSIFSGDRRVARGEPSPETHWTPAAPLARGRTYVWQVQAIRDGEREIIPAPPAPPATFRIVSERDHDELAEARRLHPGDALLHAVLAARAGLREEARRALSDAHTNIRLE